MIVLRALPQMAYKTETNMDLVPQNLRRRYGLQIRYEELCLKLRDIPIMLSVVNTLQL